MSAPNATMTPLSGWRGRSRRSRSRNRSQPALSAPASLSCVVYRPAVSMSTACSAIHQSQLRVPPTPATRPATSGKSSPEFWIAVVLPEPGGPMITYQGRS